MTSSATSPEEYINELPEDRREAMLKLRETILANMPKGFKETVCYGMISYVVPHSVYPAGYHCNPKQALPFVSIASQKNFIALYHMGIYGNPALLKWFTDEFPKYSKARLDMGKSCIRFKKPGDIPYDLIAALMKKVSVGKWIEWYESALKKR